MTAMKTIIDTNLIAQVVPDYAKGRRLGLTDQETEASAAATWSEMEQAHGGQRETVLPKLNEMSDCDGELYHIVLCGHCDNAFWHIEPWQDLDDVERFAQLVADVPTDKIAFCHQCGKKFNWSLEEYKEAHDGQ